jgi:DNA-binding winged helix-turn-helix (wHTH) protein
MNDTTDQGHLVDYLPTYRQEIITPIMRTIAAGESCSIVGVASTGKSNLFRFLIRPEVRQRYLGESWGNYLFLYIDTHSLTELSEWGLCELLLRRIVEATEDLKIESKWSKHFNDLYQQAVRPERQPLARGYLERSVKNLCQRLGFKLVFLFDEFDEIFRQMDTRFFLGLRALRDEHKYRLSCVVATRNELPRIREDIAECESFYELLSLNTFGLGPYSEADARNMVQRLAARKGMTVADDDANLLIKVSGGHPGILWATFWALNDRSIERAGDVSRQCLNEPDIQTECVKIWDSLGEDERMALADIVADCPLEQLEQEVVRLLQLKGLLVENEASQAAIFCRLFEHFVNQQEFFKGKDIRLDERSGEVWLEGKPVCPDLTNLEFTLLSYLFKRRGEICSRSELLEVLYPGEPRDLKLDMVDNRLDTLIARLRDRIELDRRRPKYIVTVRRRGFKLAEATTENL